MEKPANHPDGLGWFVADDPWWSDHHGPEVEDSYRGRIARLPHVVLLSGDGVTVEGAAIGRRAGRSDTFRKKVRFTEWVTFERFDIRPALDGLRGHTKSSARATVGASIGSFTSRAAVGILGWLEEHDHAARAAIGDLLSRPRLPGWLEDEDADGHLPYAQQYDGLRVALELARIDRDVALQRFSHPESPDDVQLASLIEDIIVTHDTYRFLDWPAVPHAVSGAVFEEPSTGRRLRTFLSNKLPIEQQTGADVIYYMEDVNAFVLVQYKRCRSENGKLIYRPDKQYEKELSRLQDLEDLSSAGSASHLSGHRIGQPFCFFKLCEPHQPLDSPISKGKYFDLRGFDLSMTLGTRRGRRVIYEQADRYITNTLFVELVTQGWIGSSGDVSEAVLKALESSLDNDRSVLLASVRYGTGNVRGGSRATNIRAGSRSFRD